MPADTAIDIPANLKETFVFETEQAAREVFEEFADVSIGASPSYESDVDTAFRARERTGNFDFEVPFSQERALLFSFAYNGFLNGSNNLIAAIKAGDRAEAWYEIRYQSQSSVAVRRSRGIAKRRFVESEQFGLYNPSTTSEEESISVYQTFTNHRTTIFDYEKEFGEAAGSNNGINLANLETVTTGVRVQTLSNSLRKAFDQLHKKYIEPVTNGTVVDVLDVQVGNDKAGNFTGNVRDKFTLATGSAKNDLILGLSGVDNLDGGEGNDFLYGGDGLDTLIGGKGNDYLQGGNGKDTYRFNYGDDRVFDNSEVAGEINQLFITHSAGEGKVPELVTRLRLLPGSDNIYAEFEGNSLAAKNNTKYVVQRTPTDASPNKQSLIIVVDGGVGAGGRITIEDWKPESFGIEIAEPIPLTPPEIPLTAFSFIVESDFDGLNTQDDQVRAWRPDRIVDGDSSERIIGSRFIDYIAGGGGDDFIDSGRSEVPVGFSDEGFFDTIAGGTGSDYLVGGDGDHLIFGGNGGSPHITFGGIGSVDINADGEFFYARASEGATDNDYIEGGAGDDHLIAGVGDDVSEYDNFIDGHSRFNVKQKMNVFCLIENKLAA